MNKKLKVQNIKVHVISLGCTKNLVDSESMIDILSNNSMQMIDEPRLANIIIINTCGFIESAKKEAIDKILEMADYKKNDNNMSTKGICDYLIVTGCLSQRYHRDIRENIPEVDAILGTSAYEEIVGVISNLYEKDNKEIQINVTQNNTISHLSVNRNPSTRGFAYLKVAEGCSNNCTYCAIPGIRGAFVSRRMEDIILEAVNLSNKGIYEIILIAQDTTRYGLDRYGQRRLPHLIKEISKIKKIEKIRLLYCYADGITDDLIHEMANNPKLAKYIEMPIQHADNNVLARMNRKDTSESIRETVKKLRESMPKIVIRTTVLVGFPGETNEEFNNLLSFIKDIKFNLLGCFVFSPEDGTPAEKMQPKISKSVAQKRQSDIMISQKEISRNLNYSMIGEEIEVVIEGVSEDGIFYLARGDGQAPEIDPFVYVIAQKKELEIGRKYAITLIDNNEYELIGVNNK